MRGEASVTDSGISRKRVLIVPHEGEVTLRPDEETREWQAKARGGTAQRLDHRFRLARWRGRIWTPNYLVQVDDPMLGFPA